MAPHDDIERLIPWYVNGTLNEAEMDRVNRHLHGCVACSASVEREVRLARDLRAEPGELRELLGAGGGWDAFAARLPARRPSRRRFPAAALASFTLAIAAAAFLAGQHLQRPEFETLTAPGGHRGPLIQVMFQPDTPEHAIRRVVLDSGGALVAGPTGTGIYRIGLPEESDAETLTRRLREQPAVRWAVVEEP